MGHGDNGFAAFLGRISSGNTAFVRRWRRSRTGHRHRVEHSDSGRSRTESSGHLSTVRPGENGCPQCNGPAHQPAAGAGRDFQPEHRSRRWQRYTESARFAPKGNVGSGRRKTRCNHSDWERIRRSQRCEHQSHSLSNDRSHRHPEGWRVGYLWQRCGGRCDQYLFDTQVPWSGDRRQLWKHKPWRLERRR